MTKAGSRQWHGAKAAWLFAVALLFKALIPAGYMIDLARALTTAWPIVLCPSGMPASALDPTPAQAVAATIDHSQHRGHANHIAATHAGHGDEHHVATTDDHTPQSSGAPADHQDGNHENKAGEHCAFSGLGASALDPPVAALPLRLPAMVATPTAVGLAMVGHGLAAPPPPATGPPTLF